MAFVSSLSMVLSAPAVLTILAGMLAAQPALAADPMPRVPEQVSLQQIRNTPQELQRQLARRGSLYRIPESVKDTLRGHGARLQQELATLPPEPSDDQLRELGVVYAEVHAATVDAALEVVRCQRERPVGTHIGHAVCLSRRELAAARDATRQNLIDQMFNDIQLPAGRPGRSMDQGGGGGGGSALTAAP